jgi:hypothetical protein
VKKTLWKANGNNLGARLPQEYRPARHAGAENDSSTKETLDAAT